MHENEAHKAREQGSRQAQLAILLGGFFAVMAVPVLVGGFLAQLRIDSILSFVAAGLLFLVGAGFVRSGLRGRPGDPP